MSNYAFYVALKSKHQKPEKSSRAIANAFANTMHRIGLSDALSSYTLEARPLSDVITASDAGCGKGNLGAESLMEIKRTLVSEGWTENNAGWYHVHCGGAFTILEALFRLTRSIQKELIEAHLTINDLGLSEVEDE
jgi:hypothetical protein